MQERSSSWILIEMLIIYMMVFCLRAESGLKEDQGENPVCRITEKYVPLDKYRYIV